MRVGIHLYETMQESIRVVVADDEPHFRDLLGTFLRRDGRFTIVGEAADGREAVELTAQHQPDVVVLDLNMPRVRGEEALAEIRDACGNVRIVIVSAFLGHHSEEALLEAGADACIAKDTPARTIVAAIGDVIRAG
jgi:DNA-binding NarL/FixJ family response regulator